MSRVGVTAALLALAGCFVDQGVPPGTEPVGQFPQVTDVNVAGLATVTTDVDPEFGNTYRAYVLDRAGRWTALGTLWPGQAGSQSQAAAVNDSGTVVGTTRSQPAASGETVTAFVWDAAGGMRAAPPPPAGMTPASQGVDVNDAGLAVVDGSVPTPLGGPAARPFLWDTGTGTTRRLEAPFGSIQAYARAINDAGVVVGQATGASGQLAVRWSPPLYAPQVLATTGVTRTDAFDIGADGTIVGSGYATSDNTYRPLRWTPSGAVEALPLYGVKLADDGTIVGAIAVGDKAAPARLRPGATQPERLPGPSLDLGFRVTAVDGTATHYIGETVLGDGGRVYRSFPKP
jgi:uncharacterized membrane protein